MPGEEWINDEYKPRRGQYRNESYAIISFIIIDIKTLASDTKNICDYIRFVPQMQE